jgi:undecaprenyl diphosphate synthase
MAIESTQEVSSEVLSEYKRHKLNPEKIPAHVAIIMDGNGRWAKKRLLPRTLGHKQGVETVRSILKAGASLGIKYLSVYTFSTENWKRPPEEVTFLMKLLKESILNELADLNKNGVRIRLLGDRESLPSDVLDALEKIEDQTKDNAVIQLNLMINYGSRREIVSAVESIVSEIKSGKIETIDEATISDHLYTKGIPDPDVLIRTSGIVRISNFMLWQLSYSEMFFVDKHWPDFKKEDLVDVLRSYQDRHRRFGGV